MKLLKKIFLLSVIILLTSCASGYKTINPNSLNYISNSTDKGVLLEYKYELLEKKYEKKELAKGVRLIAIKITNNSDKDLVFGKDIKLAYGNESNLYIMDNEKVFKTLKQSPASYLWYLLLTPLNLYTTESTNGYRTETNSIPIGLVVGPGLAGGNMIAAGSANKKFEQDLMNYNINGKIIKKGETTSGLIGVRSDNYDAIQIEVK
ncbi:hypothetical protein C7447_101592 [Tenacibaculum adriaticum]|uniref:Lipoprotein n=1 Tax=Tenacibaculum adriaticum TaxID=413713 RepID=A0A5S5DW77_9FLAO|nr:hypothetical protein [Tenacibaculum adriaticum]TYP99984.1 hypothetical protein C7447_101592 [Tenacibaculum adriaticum]